MQVKLINQALKRVQLPGLSPTKLEAFKAGVRALAYELEKDTTPELQAERCPDCCGEMETHPIKEGEFYCPSCMIDDTTPETAEYLRRVINEPPALAIVHTKPLTQQLNDLIGKVFANEQAFLAEFFPEGIAVDEFYMASERCRVVVQPEYTTTIKTADFLAWAEGLNDERT